MANQPDHEWVEAQKIVISIDLFAAAKKHLKFLGVVDSNGNLYEGPILEKAVFRYKYCWFPLFAKHIESKHPKCQLVVPLDCEWIWHCHRLNPVRYMADCKKLFGRILDPNYVAVSSIEGACKKQTEEIWKKHCSEEPYELDFSDHLKNDTKSNKVTTLPSTNYDLISAVKRQSSFYHKVLESTKTDDLHLVEAVNRYKGFLYLVKRNMEMKIKNACVPTRDIDLMWHTHQLHPLSYCKDSLALVGQVLHHDDTDNDQSKGGKLDVGITTTTKQWGEMFGSSYWRVGSMSKGTIEGMEGKKFTARCWCITENMEGKKITARCWCIADNMEGEKLTARCWCIAKNMKEEKMIARCWCIAENMEGEKMTGRCWCIAENMEGENMFARCWCIAENMEGGKLTARCWCISENMKEEKMIARCWCIAENIKEENMNARCWCIAENMEGDKLNMACQSIAKSMDGEHLTTKFCVTEGMHTRKSTPQSYSVMFVEIRVEIMEVINLPVTQKDNLVLCISKKQPDMLFFGKRRISICIEVEETPVVVLQCEPNGSYCLRLIMTRIKI